MPSSETHRLDQWLVERGLFDTRSRARDAILRGTVRVDGEVAAKPGAGVAPDAVIAIDDPAQAYVSRAALKLTAALEHFSVDPAGLHCLDIGASTGGFTQVLLERGAVKVTAVDVGHGQLHPKLAADPRIVNLEGVNARALTGEIVTPDIGLIVSDVSFISLKLALAPALALAASGARAILLVKPQFEAGRAAIGKGGLLKDAALGQRIAEDMALWLERECGWRAIGLCPSPIAGGDGNLEYLLAGEKP